MEIKMNLNEKKPLSQWGLSHISMKSGYPSPLVGGKDSR